ncbi:class I SAM-dependent methyltransferase [candidate division KSB1 bacterium]|nr:class I SAM-dependent methyltransferase [candidate division KSB1 bacterium]
MILAIPPWLQKKKTVAPYSKLALVYDFVMRHVNYREWAAFVNRIFIKNSEEIRTVLDVACGTGSFLIEFKKFNYDIAGFDFSHEMVQQARFKIRNKGLKIPLWHGNMSQFALQYQFDAIVCLYDSINYLFPVDRLGQFYQACYENLKSSGFLLFDVCTERNSIKYFKNYYDYEQTTQFRVARKSYYIEEERIHGNDFKIQFRNDRTIYYEFHRQKIYLIKEIEASIPQDLFEIVAVLDGFTENRGSEASERVHFLLKKI